MLEKEMDDFLVTGKQSLQNMPLQSHYTKERHPLHHTLQIQIFHPAVMLNAVTKHVIIFHLHLSIPGA